MIERQRGVGENLKQGIGEGEGKNEFGRDIKAEHRRLVIFQSTC